MELCSYGLEKKEAMSESMSKLERSRMQVILSYLNSNKEISSAVAADLFDVEDMILFVN